jgi:hypothetical protein
MNSWGQFLALSLFLPAKNFAIHFLGMTFAQKNEYPMYKNEFFKKVIN